MSKRITRNTSYLSLLENSLNELFSPRSKKALLNYKELELLNLDDLRLVNARELRLLDMKQLHLFDFAVLSVFFQYIGALSITLAMGFMVGLGAYALHGTFNTTVLAQDAPSVYNYANSEKSVESVTFRAIDSRRASSSSTFEVLIANNEGGSASTVEVRVLGTSDVLDEAAVGRESCSFTVTEGEKTLKYSDGSKLSSANQYKICVDSNKSSTSFLWGLGSQTTETSSNCINSSALNGLSSVTVSLAADSDLSVASCSLSLEGQRVIAQAN